MLPSRLSSGAEAGNGGCSNRESKAWNFYACFSLCMSCFDLQAVACERLSVVFCQRCLAEAHTLFNKLLYLEKRSNSIQPSFKFCMPCMRKRIKIVVAGWMKHANLMFYIQTS